MWTDNETKTDLIGFRVHADLIRNVVTDEKVLPTVLGVFGDWGGGKSSIMQMLEDDLKTDVRYKDDVICLYFNGWMFEGYEDAKTALLTSILKELKSNERFDAKIKNQIDSLLQRVDYMVNSQGRRQICLEVRYPNTGNRSFRRKGSGTRSCAVRFDSQ